MLVFKTIQGHPISHRLTQQNAVPLVGDRTRYMQSNCRRSGMAGVNMGSRHLSWPCCDFHLRPPGWHFTGLMIWVREQDLNLRFSTYEADEDNRTPLSRINLVPIGDLNP